MINGPNIIGNPLRIAVGLLAASYVIGEFIVPKYPLMYAIKLIGILGLISSTFILFLDSIYLNLMMKILNLHQQLIG